MKYSKSKQPRKKRKALYEAPLHARQKFVAAHLSKELRAKAKHRSVKLRKGDKVKVLRGKFKKKEGKVVRVNLKKSAAFIEGCLVKTQGGKELLVPIHASNLLVLELSNRTPRAKKAGSEVGG